MDLTIDSLVLEAKILGIDLLGLGNAEREIRNQLIADAIRNYTASKGKNLGYKHAEQFRYEKFGMLEMVLGQEITKPDFPSFPIQ